MHKLVSKHKLAELFIAEGNRPAAIHCTKSCCRGSLRLEVADVSLVSGDNRDAQRGHAVIASCFSRSGRSSISSNGVLDLGEQTAPQKWLQTTSFLSVFSIIQCFPPPQSSHRCNALGSGASRLAAAFLCFYLRDLIPIISSLHLVSGVPYPLWRTLLTGTRTPGRVSASPPHQPLQLLGRTEPDSDGQRLRRSQSSTAPPQLPATFPDHFQFGDLCPRPSK